MRRPQASSCRSSERGRNVLWDTKQSDRSLPRSFGTSIASQPFCPPEPRMSTRSPRKEYWQLLLRWPGDLGKRHFNSLMTQYLHTRAPMFSATPIPPEQRLFPNGERVQEHTHAGSGFAVAFPFHWHCSRSGQGRQLRMLAAYTTRKLPSTSRRRSWTSRRLPAGHRSVP